MTVYMTKERWTNTHNTFTGTLHGRKAVLTVTGIDYVEIVPATDERVDSTGYGRVA